MKWTLVLGIMLTTAFAQTRKTSSLQLVRNATVVFNYAGREFLIDPMLAPQGAYSGFEGTVNSHLRNPLVELPFAVDQLLQPDAIVVTHTHLDHWDEAAMKLLPKKIPLFAQDQVDATCIRAAGFQDVRILSDSSFFEGVNLKKIAVQHGSDAAYANAQLAEVLGKVSGVFFNRKGLKSVYLVGDGVWTRDFENQLRQLQPDVVVINTGFAQLEGFGAMIMGKEDVGKIHQLLPQSTIICIHMEAVNHCVLSRKELLNYIHAKELSNWVIVPQDGEIMVLDL